MNKLAIAFIFFGMGRVALCGEPTVSPAETILKNLKEANSARSTLESERAAWNNEKKRLMMLRDVLKEETKRLDEKAAQAKAKSEKIRKESSVMLSMIEEFRVLESVADRIAARLREALDSLSFRSLPGVIPLAGGAGDTPGQRLDQSLKSLHEAEKNTEEWSVEIVSGMLEKEELVVRLLRAGNTSAWWLSLDEKLSGTASMRHGRLQLVKCTDSEIQERIRTVFAIQAGRAAPAWIALPLPSKATGKEKE